MLGRTEFIGRNVEEFSASAGPPHPPHRTCRVNGADGFRAALADAARRQQLLAGEPGGVVRSEKDRDRGDVADSTCAP